MSEKTSGPKPGITLEIQPPAGGLSRTLHLSWEHLGHLLRFGVFATFLTMSLVATWWYYASGYLQTAALPAIVATLQEDQSRIQSLAVQLEESEALYGRLWALLGAGRGDPGAVWLPPPPALAGLDLPDPDPVDGGTPEPPSGWPLVERAFLSQPLAQDPTEPSAHPGIDLAIPSGSYILAVAPGRVTTTGEDPIYGLYLIIQHADGWESRYAHASVLAVETGDLVAEGDVLALTGSSGRSTAPHLHFELLRWGRPVDPLGYLTRP
jgi:murein DD-endopeptidase MepM/ murein hydrolase activator NlpD